MIPKNRPKFDEDVKLWWITNWEAMNTYLDILEERWYASQMKLAIYHRKMKMHFNLKVRRITFKVGDIFKKIFIAHKEIWLGSLVLNWEGPYTVVEVIKLRTYELVDENEEPLKHPWIENIQENIINKEPHV